MKWPWQKNQVTVEVSQPSDILTELVIQQVVVSEDDSHKVLSNGSNTFHVNCAFEKNGHRIRASAELLLWFWDYGTKIDIRRSSDNSKASITVDHVPIILSKGARYRLMVAFADRYIRSVLRNHNQKILDSEFKALDGISAIMGIGDEQT